LSKKKKKGRRQQRTRRRRRDDGPCVTCLTLIRNGNIWCWRNDAMMDVRDLLDQVAADREFYYESRQRPHTKQTRHFSALCNRRSAIILPRRPWCRNWNKKTVLFCDAESQISKHVLPAAIPSWAGTVFNVSVCVCVCLSVCVSACMSTNRKLALETFLVTWTAVISGCEYFGRCCMFVQLSQQNLVSTITLQPLQMRTWSLARM